MGLCLETNEVVGAEGFEPPTSCAERKRSTRLSYAPTARNEHDFGEDSGARTHDLLGFETLALYQLSYVLVNHTKDTNTLCRRERNRTPDRRIWNPLLYQLRYAPAKNTLQKGTIELFTHFC